jgi:hypothetical protein
MKSTKRPGESEKFVDYLGLEKPGETLTLIMFLLPVMLRELESKKWPPMKRESLVSEIKRVGTIPILFSEVNKEADRENELMRPKESEHNEPKLNSNKVNL